MLDAFSSIYQYSRKTTEKVGIYYLSLENEKHATEEENPEYKAWQEKREFLENLKTIDKDHISGLLKLSVPPEKIKTEKIEKKIVQKKLNEVDKDISTLYLRKQDMSKLLSALSQFRDKKDVLKSLGFPNKLNILLDGEPGTGKSTTIQAVATYLHKDIYYVDIKDATSNQDLQMMFEYVNKNVSQGGIIVMEDIDAMTHIVRKRTSMPNDTTSPNDRGADKTVTELMKTTENKITLEYFLNILQGTLTLDDSIFITTTNWIDVLDKAFYRDGRFDVKIHFKLCDHYQISNIYQRVIGRSVPSSLLSRIPEDKFSPATILFHLKNYIFDIERSDEDILEPFLGKGG